MQQKSKASLTHRSAVARAQRSPKFRRWGRGRILVRVKYFDSSPLKSRAEEKHHTPAELGKLWGLSVDTIRALFMREPGVLKHGNSSPGKRPYVTLRIPMSVALRVHNRLST